MGLPRYLVLFALLLLAPPARGDGPAIALGPVPEAPVIEPDEEFQCSGQLLVGNDDGSWENGLAWAGNGVVEAGDYGAWAECFDAVFVCAVQFHFAQIGDYADQAMDVCLWDYIDGKNPTPGNVMCLRPDFHLESPPLTWPSVSIHEVVVCQETNGLHFMGFWPNWPGADPGWYVASDENGPGLGCPRTNIAPGVGYPTGWQHPNVVGPFGLTKSLGIRIYSGSGVDCKPLPTRQTTWGAIKSLY